MVGAVTRPVGPDLINMDESQAEFGRTINRDDLAFAVLVLLNSYYVAEQKGLPSEVVTYTRRRWPLD